MNRFACGLALWMVATVVVAAGAGGPQLLEANVNLNNKISLQRGARLFVNYCLSCHSAEYMRYNRMAKDIELSEDVVKASMMFTTEKIGETMTVAMRPENAEQWFGGVVPSDLSVIARSRGPDWIFNYLLSFYRDDDPSRLFGVNNLIFDGRLR